MLIQVTLQSVEKVKRKLKKRIHWYEDDKKLQFAFISEMECKRLKGIQGIRDVSQNSLVLTESRLGR